MGYMAEKIIDVATENGVPVYEDNSLSTILSRLELGQEIPPELYQAVVEIYVYFLHFDPNARAQPPAEKNEAAQAEEEAKQPEEEAKQAEEEVPNESTE
jgi:flagellar biosynthesis protein